MAKPELRDHRKFLRLKRLLDAPTPHVLGYLDCLWHRGYQTGNPFIGDSDDVEAAAEYPGERGRFTTAALDAGLIDADGSGFSIHDLYDHAPQYAKQRMQRRGKRPEKHSPGINQNSPNGVHHSPGINQNSPRGDQRPPCGDENSEKLTAWRIEERAENQEPRTKNREVAPPLSFDVVKCFDELENLWLNKKKINFARRWWMAKLPDEILARKILRAAKSLVESTDVRFVPNLENWLVTGDFEIRERSAPKGNYEREGPKYATLESQILPDRKDALD